jgi:prolyl 4-hydroxylase
VCIEALNLNANGEAIIHNDVGESNTLRFAFLNNSVKPKMYQRKKITGSGGLASIDWNEVKQLLVRELKLMPEGPRQQPWAIFTPLGERIVGENDVVSKGGNNSDDVASLSSNTHILQTLASSGMVLVFQGGNWRWPGVREGFQRQIELSPTLDFTDDYSTEKRNITIETLSMTPLVVSIKGFLSEEECDHIAKTAGPRMEYSAVSLKDVDKGKAASNWRTSQSAFLSSGGDPILTAIDHRTASLSRVPKGHQEVLQVLRYGQHEKYDAHHDYFDPRDYQSDKSTMNLIQNGKRNRYATVFWYLTTVKEGGETIFPNFRNRPLPRGYVHSDCNYGLKVKPQKGKVIIFYSLDARGQMDPNSLHGACPVIGEDDVKYAANKWIWNAPMGFTPSD